MRTSEALALLDRHQALVLDQLAQARELARHPPEVARGRLAQVRWQLVRRLREYQLFKHVEIFDPVIGSAWVHRTVAARQLKASCIDAGESYRAHVRRWARDDIAARWPDYQRALLGMADAIERHLATERRAVHELLAGYDRTRRN